MHPRISVNSVCLPGDSVSADLQAWKSIGVQTVGVHVRKLKASGWASCIEVLKSAGLRFSSVVHPLTLRLDQPAAWPKEQEEFKNTVDMAKAIGAESIYTTSGCRGGLEWKDAARAFCQLMRPVVDYANSSGVRFLVEPTTALQAEISIVHTLRDTIRLAEQAGMGLNIDIYHCWTDSDLQESIRAGIRNTGLVQVSDYVLGDRFLPARAIPGEGDIPLERILGWMLDAGYEGVFDLELKGPRIDAAGIQRACDWLERYLAGSRR